MIKDCENTEKKGNALKRDNLLQWKYTQFCPLKVDLTFWKQFFSPSLGLMKKPTKKSA
jgi:hypothetical protein